MFPIEIDLDQVRRQREHGMRGLGQVLKSFRDRSTDFSVYDRTSGTDAYLNTLGPLHIPTKGSRIGIEDTHAPIVTSPIQYSAGPTDQRVDQITTDPSASISMTAGSVQQTGVDK